MRTGNEGREKHKDNGALRVRDYIVYFVGYSVLFAAVAAAVFVWFWMKRKRFVWQTDGVNQHYYGLLYFARWGKEVIRQFQETHVLRFPTFSLRMGYGEDLFTTLTYYVIGDPFSLPAIFVPEQHLLLFHDLMLMVRFWLAGITFSAYSFYMGRRSRLGVLAGAMIYVFNGFTMSGMRHHYFLNPFVFFPLLLLGCERYFRKKKPGLFIFMVFVSAVSNFYFFYMLVIMTVLYAVWRSVRLRGFRHFGRVILDGIAFLFYGLLGTMLAAFVFLPVVLRFLQDPRAANTKTIPFFWTESFYRNFLDCFLTNGTSALSESWTYMGFGAVAALCVLFIFAGRKKHFDLKVSFIGLTCLLMTPMAGYVMNGFSYPANRWMWAYALLVGYMTATAFPELVEAGRKQLAASFVLMFILAAVCAAWSYTFSRESGTAFVLGLFSLGAVLLGRVFILEKKAERAALSGTGGNMSDPSVSPDVYYAAADSSAAGEARAANASSAADEARAANASSAAGEALAANASSAAGEALAASSASAAGEARAAAGVSAAESRKVSVRVQAVMLVCVVLTIALAGYFDYSPERSAKVFEYLSRAQIETQTAKDSAAAAELIDGQLLKNKEGTVPFYRYTTYNPENNTSMLYGVSNTQYYWSLSNSDVVGFLAETGQLNRMIHLYDTLDDRTALNEIAGIRYFLGSDKEGFPYGYEKIEGLSYDNYDLWPELESLERYSCEIYENKYALPFGFTSDKWISREDYDALDIPQRQQALMQGILLEREPVDNFTKITPGKTTGTTAGAAAAGTQASGSTIAFSDQRETVEFVLDPGKITATGLTETKASGIVASGNQATAAAAGNQATAAAAGNQATATAAGNQATAAAAGNQATAAAAGTTAAGNQDAVQSANTAAGADGTLTADAFGETDTVIMKASGKGEKISFEVLEGGAVVSLRFNGLPSSETGLYIRGMQYQEPEGESGLTKFLLPVRGFSGGQIVADKQFGFTTPLDPWTTGQTDFLINMRYHEQAVDRIDITFPARGTYSFDSIEAVCQPMVSYPAQAEALRETTLQNLDIHEMGTSSATDRISGHIDLDKPEILCLQIPCTPGWTAYVDGVKAELLQADTMFSALLLPAGSHDIELRYQTPGLRLGAFISAGTLFLILLFGIIYTIVSLILGLGEKRREAIPEGAYKETPSVDQTSSTVQASADNDASSSVQVSSDNKPFPAVPTAAERQPVSENNDSSSVSAPSKIQQSAEDKGSGF